MQEHNQHWTSDPELVERYVLNRLDVADRPPLVAHLRTCSACARVVRDEEILVAGIRAHGRAGLKARLKQRVAAERGKGLSWYQLVGAAAAIVILVTVGVHNRWFMEEGVKQSPLNVERTEEDQTSSRVERDDAEKSVIRISPDPGEGEADPRTTGAVAAPPSAIQGPAQLRMKDERSPAPVALAPRSALEEYPTASKAAPSTVTMLRKGPEVWLEGRVLESEVQPSRTLNLRDQVEVESKLQATEPGAAKRSEDRMMMRGKGDPQGVLQILQRSLSDLPQTRQASRRDPGSVPALVMQSDSLTQLTLFLDSLLSEVDLGRASIEQVTPDSIVIELGSQRIGYKVPTWVDVPLQLHRGRR